MNKKRDRMVYRRRDGKWVNKRVGASRAKDAHDTQAEASIQLEAPCATKEGVN